MASKRHDRAQLNELLYQALETESGGIEIYQMALECAVNDDLREEWQGYLDETRRHYKMWKPRSAHRAPSRRASRC